MNDFKVSSRAVLLCSLSLSRLQCTFPILHQTAEVGAFHDKGSAHEEFSINPCLMGVAPSVCELKAALEADFQGQLAFKFCLPGTSYAVGSHAVCGPNENSAAKLGLPCEPLVVQLVANGGHLLPTGPERGACSGELAGAQALEDGSPAAIAQFLAELDQVSLPSSVHLIFKLPAPVWLWKLSQMEARSTTVQAKQRLCASAGAGRGAVRGHCGARR